MDSDNVISSCHLPIDGLGVLGKRYGSGYQMGEEEKGEGIARAEGNVGGVGP
jgi:hypothetical protein